MCEVEVCGCEESLALQKRVETLEKSLIIFTQDDNIQETEGSFKSYKKRKK